MAWLEMNREPEKRQKGWGLGECLTSPQHKANSSSWAFWETMLEVKKGDIVFHLTGKAPKSYFVGYSIAKNPALKIPSPNIFNKSIYKVELENYEPLTSPINWTNLHEIKDRELRQYFLENKKKRNKKDRLFYVIQNNHIQCLNGAYLSYLSDELLDILFDIKIEQSSYDISVVVDNIGTNTQLKNVALRIGQNKFSNNVKNNYLHKCCFPGCSIDQDNFLIGAHIARWADDPELRGNTSNGLCLCIFHDKAFEIGAFTIDRNLKVLINSSKELTKNLSRILQPANHKLISNCIIQPSIEALAHHWERHNFDI